MFHQEKIEKSLVGGGGEMKRQAKKRKKLTLPTYKGEKKITL
jgi:hypothetical protein